MRVVLIAGVLLLTGCAGDEVDVAGANARQALYETEKLRSEVSDLESRISELEEKLGE